MAEVLCVPDAAAGQRLDVFLGDQVGSRASAQKLIDAGRVSVDGRARVKRHVLAGGEEIRIRDPAPAERMPDLPPAEFAIAHQDDHLLVVDKPAGVVVHPGSGRPIGTLVQSLGTMVAGGDDPDRPGIVHRLDRDTSGLLVVARDEATHRALREAIAAREVVREYLALVQGRPAARTGTIDAPLGRDRRLRTRISTDTDDPHAAVTHFEVERALASSTLLRVRLETGRTHQIRAHLLAIGHPVLGDPDYGIPGRHGLGRQFLHAEHLAFDHPVTAERIDVRSPLPADLRTALDRAERAGP